MNIAFEYLYRDAGNYKKWGRVVFANPAKLPIADILKEARCSLIDQSFFDARSIDVPDLHFEHWNPELDHNWHEMDSIIQTSDEATDVRQRSVQAFLFEISESCRLQIL